MLIPFLETNLNQIIFGVILVSLLCAFLYYKKIHEGMSNKVPAAPVVSPDFIPCSGFTGEKIGYVFKTDSDGLGYYKDPM